MSTQPPRSPTPHPDGDITVEQRGHVLLIGIDRVAKRNGFTARMFSELAQAIGRLDATDDAFCGLLYAHGDHFTAGVDLASVAELRRAGQPLVPVGLVDPFNMRAPLRRKPLVIALQGICFTVAVELLLGCEVAVAAEDCRFSQLEVKRGIAPTGGATVRMVQRAGWGNAMELLLTGKEFDAHHAKRLGFVQHVVPAGEQFDAALAIAQDIAAQAPLAVQAVMDNAREALGPYGQAAWEKIEAVQHRLYNSEDAKEGVASFREKRPARFVGR